MTFTISNFDIIQAALQQIAGLTLLQDEQADQLTYWVTDKDGVVLGSISYGVLMHLFEEVVSKDLSRRVLNNVRAAPKARGEAA